MKKIQTRQWTSLTFILCLVCCAAWPVDAQTNGADSAQASLIRERIQAIMRETIKSGETTITTGGQIVIATTFVPPSEWAVAEIKRYGERAVPILAEYLRMPTGFAKWHATRFLGEIGGESVVEPLREVALHDGSAGYREAALGWLTQAPWELAAPILEESASSDPDAEVRQKARDLLLGHGLR